MDVQRPITEIRGIVTPAEWGPDSNVRAVSILTVDEQDYLVHPDAVGRRFLALTRRGVVACGRVVGVRAGRPVFSVATYEVFGEVVDWDRPGGRAGGLGR